MKKQIDVKEMWVSCANRDISMYCQKLCAEYLELPFPENLEPMAKNGEAIINQFPEIDDFVGHMNMQFGMIEPSPELIKPLIHELTEVLREVYDKNIPDDLKIELIAIFNPEPEKKKVISLCPGNDTIQ